MNSITIAFAPIIRSTFDVPFAEEKVMQAQALLAQAEIPFIAPAQALATLADAQTYAEECANQRIDALLVFQATFADSGMVSHLAQTLDVPLLLWAVPEPHTGGRLRLNSLCGINLAGHALRRAQVAYEYLYADPSSAEASAQIERFVRVVRVYALLHETRLGIVGEHPDGFETCIVNEHGLAETFGVGVERLHLQDEVFDAVRQVEDSAAIALLETLKPQLSNIEGDAATLGTLKTYITLADMATSRDLRGFAVRCWPEFFTELGCAACGAMSLLNGAKIPGGCEADINGTLTQLILQSLSGASAFGTDVVSVDVERDGLVLWHCGQAPLDMADPHGAPPQVTLHSNRKLPMLMQFTLRAGQVTIARLSEASGTFRLVIGLGEVVSAPPSFSGTSGILSFGDKPASAVLDTILQEGLEHHIAITYGNYTQELKMLAKMWSIPTLIL